MIDNDTRTPDQQYTDFITRPGDFHQLHITIPNPTTGANTAAECVIKYTPDEQPLVLEVLRQLRGALNATITLVRLEPPPPEVDTERQRIADQHGVPIDWVLPAPSPTGHTAWTITPPPRPPAGRHAKPDDKDEEIVRALSCGLGINDDSDWCALDWGHVGEHATANGAHRWGWP